LADGTTVPTASGNTTFTGNNTFTGLSTFNNVTVTGQIISSGNNTFTGLSTFNNLTVTGAALLTGLTQDNALTRVLVQNAATGRLYWRDSTSIGGAGSGHIIVNAGGADLTARPRLAFISNMLAADNVGANRTDVSVDTGASFNWTGAHFFSGNVFLTANSSASAQFTFSNILISTGDASFTGPSFFVAAPDTRITALNLSHSGLRSFSGIEVMGQDGSLPLVVAQAINTTGVAYGTNFTAQLPFDVGVNEIIFIRNITVGAYAFLRVVAVGVPNTLTLLAGAQMNFATNYMAVNLGGPGSVFEIANPGDAGLLELAEPLFAPEGEALGTSRTWLTHQGTVTSATATGRLNSTVLSKMGDIRNAYGFTGQTEGVAFGGAAGTAQMLFLATETRMRNVPQDDTIAQIIGLDALGEVRWRDAATLVGGGGAFPGLAATYAWTGAHSWANNAAFNGQIALNNTNITQDDALVRVIVMNATTGRLYWRASSTIGAGGGFYQTVQLNGGPFTQRPILNFANDFNGSDSVGSTRTDITFNQAVSRTWAGYNIFTNLSDGLSSHGIAESNLGPSIFGRTTSFISSAGSPIDLTAVAFGGSFSPILPGVFGDGLVDGDIIVLLSSGGVPRNQAIIRVDVAATPTCTFLAGDQALYAAGTTLTINLGVSGWPMIVAQSGTAAAGDNGPLPILPADSGLSGAVLTHNATVSSSNAAGRLNTAYLAKWGDIRNAFGIANVLTPGFALGAATGVAQIIFRAASTYLRNVPQDDTDTRMLTWDAATGELSWRDAATIGAGGGAPVGAQYIVSATDATLTAERVATDTASIAWNFGTAGQAQANIVANGVTNAMLAQVATATFKGRTTAATGNVEDLTVAQATALLGVFTTALQGVVPASGGGAVNFLRADGVWAAPAGAGGAPIAAQYIVAATDATLSAERVATDTATITWNFGTAGQAQANVVANAVGNTQIRQAAALSIIGNTTNATANVADIAAGTDGFVLRRSGTALAFGQIAAAAVPNDLVSNALLANVPTATFKGRTTAATGDPEDLTVAQATALLAIFTTALQGVVPASGGGTANFLRADGTWAAPAGAGGGYATIQEEGASLAQRPTVNYIGAGITATDDVGNTRTNVSLGDDLNALEGMTGAGFVVRTADNTYALRAITTSGIGITNGTGVAGNVVLSLDNNSVTNAILRDSAAVSVIGRSANSAGDPADIAAGSNDTVLRRVADVLGFGQLTAGMFPANVVTNAMLAQVATATFKGRTTAATGDVQDLTVAQATALLAVFTTALQGVVPASGGGTTNFLRADGTWAAPAGGAFPGLGATYAWTNAHSWANNAAFNGDATFAGQVFATNTVQDDALVRVVVQNATTGRFYWRDVATIGAGGGAPVGAQYIVGAVDGTLSAERVATDTATIAWNFGTAGQALANVVANSIGNAQFRQGIGTSVVGRSGGTTGDVADIQAGTDGHVLRRLSSANLSFGQISGADSIVVGTVTNAVISNRAPLTVMGRSANSTGVVADIQAVADDVIFRRTASTLDFGLLTAGMFPANVVTNAMLAQVATATFKGRTTAATGNVQDLTVAQATALLAVFTTALQGVVPASGGGTTNFLRADGTWAAPPGGGGGYATIQEEAGALAARTIMNFVGAGITAADDVGNTRTNITLATVLNTIATNGGVGAAEIVDNTVGNTEIRQGAAVSIIGRSANSTGNVADIAAGANDTILRRVANALDFGALTAGMFPANIVADAAIRQSAALSVVGRSANSTGNVADIAAAADNEVLRRSGTAIGFGAINLASSAAVTGDLPYANIVPAAAASLLLGRGAAGGAGDWQEVTLGTNLSMTGTVLNAAAGGGGSGGFYELGDYNAMLRTATFADLVQANGTNIPVRGLSFATGEQAFWRFRTRGYTSGNLTVAIDWYADTGTTGDAVWGASIAAITPATDTQDIETDALATQTTTTTTHLGTTGQRLHRTTVTVSNLDSLAADDNVTLRIERVAAGNTLAGNIIMVNGSQVSWS